MSFASALYIERAQLIQLDSQKISLLSELTQTRDIERKIKDFPNLQEMFAHLLDLSNRLLLQDKTSSKKLYSLNAPEVYCMSKGKAGKPYEFGCKVSLVNTPSKTWRYRLRR